MERKEKSLKKNLDLKFVINLNFIKNSYKNINNV